MTGGSVRRPQSGLGKFVFVNVQKTVKENNLMEPVTTLARILRSNVAMESGDHFTVESASDLVKHHDALGAVFIIDNPELPISLVATEAKWGLVNVAALNTPEVDDVLLASRVRREMWRVFAMMNGACNSTFKQCLMQDAFSPKDIDALPAQSFCPEPMGKIMTHLSAMGVKPFETCTYKDACEEGWAPAPTNDVQKAIWDKVHSLPTNPIKIKFDPDTDGKDKE